MSGSARSPPSNRGLGSGSWRRVHQFGCDLIMVVKDLNADKDRSTEVTWTITEIGPSPRSIRPAVGGRGSREFAV